MIDNWTYPEVSNGYFLKHSSSTGYANITGFQFKNTNTYGRIPLYLNGVPSLKMINSAIDNIQIYNGKRFVSTVILSEMQLSNITFTRVQAVDIGDGENSILYIDGFDIGKTTNFIISNVTVSESTIPFLIFNKITNYANAVKTFTINQFEYKNSTFDQQNDLIQFSKLEHDVDFTIALTNIKFSDLEFAVKGNLMHFQHQLKNQLTISNLRITNTKNWHIVLAANNPQNKVLPLKVKITDFVTENVNAGFNSLMQVYQLSVLELHNSILHNVYNFGEGAVLLVSGQLSSTSFQNWSMQYNSAISGGVFKAEDNGAVQIYASQIANNFASVGGVFSMTNGGNSEIKRTLLRDNMAVQSPIGQVQDSYIASIVGNCTIYSNTHFEKQYVIDLITSSIDWKELCFLKTVYKQYLIDHQELIVDTASFYLFQLLSASFEINNNTLITSQESLVDAFVASITIHNTVIRDWVFNGIPIQITGSTLDFKDITMYNLDTQTSKMRLITGTLDSTVYMTNIKYTNSDVPFFFFQGSTAHISNVTWAGLYFRTSVGRIEQGVNTTIEHFDIDDFGKSHFPHLYYRHGSWCGIWILRFIYPLY